MQDQHCVKEGCIPSCMGLVGMQDQYCVKEVVSHHVWDYSAH